MSPAAAAIPLRMLSIGKLPNELQLLPDYIEDQMIRPGITLYKLRLIQRPIFTLILLCQKCLYANTLIGIRSRCLIASPCLYSNIRD